MLTITATVVWAEPDSGRLVLLADDDSVAGTTTEALHLGTHIDLSVQGLQAQVLVSQTFKNQTDEWVSATYVYPLAEDSAVSRLKMVVGERVIEGEIQEKAQARKTFEAAKVAGKKATLIEQQRPNLFRQQIANIAPGETVRIDLGYSQQVIYDSGEFRLRLPLTLTPRYIPGVVSTELEAIQTLTTGAQGWARATDQVKDAASITPLQKYAAVGKVVNPVSIDLKLDAGMPLAWVRSATHQLTVNQPKGDDLGKRRIHFSQAKVSMDRDFEISWQPTAQSAPVAAQFVSEWQDERYLQLMLMPPREVASSRLTPRELVLVVDTSGSMAGDSIKQARASALLALDTLTAQDRFNVILFSSDTRAVFSDVVTATADNLKVAAKALASMQANGGTEILPALEQAFSYKKDAEHLQQIVFLTDGSVGNEAALLQHIHRNLGDARLFTVAIGSAPNRFFMRRAAEFGRGSFTEIASAAQIEQRMADLLNKLKSPVVTNITIDWPQPVQMYPRRIPDLYWGEPLLVTAKLSPWPSGSQPMITVRGTSAGKSWQRDLVLNTVAGQSDTKLLPVLAQRFGREKIKFLENELYVNGRDVNNEAQQEILPVALKYQLMSRYTSLVAVDKTPVRPAESALRERAVSNAMPAGATMQALSYPQTALGVSWHLLLGALALLALIVLKGMEVRYAEA
ncbi:marine proteobacterial sortase target protein [Gilvimarinus polysaccharolyticus]|uniref:marine proteobacterial sortase target protein n=1 Tax=Gilvimarinus polysaccharolyticus TaxID=863921 RepID=UPI00067335A7|nr:marine proteobacterial sortase target protein [Gilvimarinus polysaccharolyticus]